METLSRARTEKPYLKLESRLLTEYSLTVLVPMLSHCVELRYVRSVHVDGMSSSPVAGKKVERVWKSEPFLHSDSNMKLTELPFTGAPISESGIAISKRRPLLPAPSTAEIFVSDALISHPDPFPEYVIIVPFS